MMIVLFVIGANARLSAQSQGLEVKVHSPGLEHKLLGDTADQNVAIYLPAAYRGEPQERVETRVAVVLETTQALSLKAQ